MLAVDRPAHRIRHEPARHALAPSPARAGAAPDRTAPWSRDRRPARAPRNRPRPRMSPTCGWSAERTAQALARGPRRARARWRAGRRRAIISCTASAAAHASGCPMYVWPCWKKPLPRAARRRSFCDEHRADRLIAAAQSLGDRHQVGHDAFLLARVQRAGAAHAAHHFVEDQQDAVAVAELADAAGSSPASAGTAPAVAPTTVSATNAMTLSGAEALDRRLELVARAAAPYCSASPAARGRGTRSRARHASTSISSGANCARRHALPPTASAPSVLP